MFGMCRFSSYRFCSQGSTPLDPLCTTGSMGWILAGSVLVGLVHACSVRTGSVLIGSTPLDPYVPQILS